MNTDDSRLIARFQRLTTELLAQKRLGQWHPELVDELYRTSLELEQRRLKKIVLGVGIFWHNGQSRGAG